MVGYPRDGDRVHVTDEYDATGSDSEEFGRCTFLTELNWTEKQSIVSGKKHTTTECETCEREDDEGNERYSCNCVETYHYTKTWRNHRVNSLLLINNNHHNPQRDPFPSRSLSAMDMSVKAGIGISPSIVANFRGPTWPLVFTHGGRAIPRWVF